MKRESPWPSFILAFAIWLFIIALGLWLTLVILGWILSQFPVRH